MMVVASNKDGGSDNNVSGDRGVTTAAPPPAPPAPPAAATPLETLLAIANKRNSSSSSNHHNNINNGDEISSALDSLVDGFSLNLTDNNKNSNNKNDDNETVTSEVTETSEVTWLTYRDEKCSEVKEEFIKQLKSQSQAQQRTLSIEERKVLLEEIVREQRVRDEGEKERRKSLQKQERRRERRRQRRGQHMRDDDDENDGTTIPSPSSLGRSNGDENGSIDNGGGEGREGSSLVEGGGGSGGLLLQDSEQQQQQQQQGGVVTERRGSELLNSMGMDVVAEETRSSDTKSGEDASNGDANGDASNREEERHSSGGSSTSQHSSSSLSRRSSLPHGEEEHYIESIVNLKLLVANQQTMIDALTSKLNNAELAHNILQTENNILKKDNELQQQQLIQAKREVVESQHLLEKQKSTLRRRASGKSSLSRENSVETTVTASFSSNATPPANNVSNNNNGKSQTTDAHTMDALQSKLKMMDQINKQLLLEKFQLQREISSLKKGSSSGGGGGAVTTAAATASTDIPVIEEEEDEVEEKEDENHPKLTMEAVKTHDSNSSSGGKQILLDPTDHFIIPKIPNSAALASPWAVKGNNYLLAATTTTEGGGAYIEIKVPSVPSGSERGSESDNRRSRTSSESNERPSASASGTLSSDNQGRGGGAGGSKSVSSSKLFGGLASRLSSTFSGISRPGGNPTVRVEDLSKDLIPIVGTSKFCVMLYNVLSPEECAGLVRRTKDEQFEELSYYKSGGEGMSANISSCKLCRLRDSDLAEDIFGRISNALRGTAVEQTFRRFPTPSERQSVSDTSSVASTIRRKSSAGTGTSGPTEGVVTRINLPLNVLRYDVGEFFAPHRDNTFRSGTEVSRLTLQIFLNEKFSGGVTSIRDGKKFFDIKPKMGSVLLVDQELRREECYVVSGKKYVMRADVMYDEATKK